MGIKGVEGWLQSQVQSSYRRVNTHMDDLKNTDDPTLYFTGGQEDHKTSTLWSKVGDTSLNVRKIKQAISLDLLIR